MTCTEVDMPCTELKLLNAAPDDGDLTVRADRGGMDITCSRPSKYALPTLTAVSVRLSSDSATRLFHWLKRNADALGIVT